MAKKKNPTKIDILTLYMEFVSEFRMRPDNISDFCNNVNLKESDFEKHFSSFKKVEKTVFKELFKNSIEVLEESEDFAAFDGKNKLLSLYFTFFENLNLNRAYMEVVLKGCSNHLKSHKSLTGLKKQFIGFINTLELSESFLPIEGLEKVQQTVVSQTAWVQFLVTIKFWLEDKSESFEKTDIFIEKSINTSFELLENKFLKNAFDLGKFVYKETFQKKG